MINICLKISSWNEDPCFPNPCLFGGKCTATDEIQYSCSCVGGFTGPLDLSNFK